MPLRVPRVHWLHLTPQKGSDIPTGPRFLPVHYLLALRSKKSFWNSWFAGSSCLCELQSMLSIVGPYWGWTQNIIWALQYGPYRSPCMGSISLGLASIIMTRAQWGLLGALKHDVVAGWFPTAPSDAQSATGERRRWKPAWILGEGFPLQ